jgi:two-component system, NarL family, sensor histidine kinase UhpB
VRRLRGQPTLLRLIAANAGIVLAGAVGGTALTRRFDDWPTWALVVVFFCLGAAMIVAADYAILRNTFRPLVDLSRAMATVHKGERASALTVDDGEPSLLGVARAASEMLDRIDLESRAYSAKVFESIENERRRIGRELHDETSQSLAAALLNLDLAEKSLDPAAAATVERIATARQLIRHGLGQVKLLIHDLRPSMLDDFGLVPALRWYVQSHLQGAGLEVEVELPEVNWRLPSDVETALYRIAQESLGNVARHSQATRALLSLEIQSGYAALVVSDNGIGFEPKDVILDREGRYGVGLLSIRERAELLGGTARITSAPQRGTQVHVVIPLHGEAAEGVNEQ